MLLIRSGISVPISITIDVYNYHRTVYTNMGVIIRLVVPATVTVPVAVATIIMVVPVVVVPVIIMPVMSSPWAPVVWVISPVPG